MDGFLANEYYGNTVVDWLIALAIILGAVIVGKLLYWVFGSVFKKLTAKSKTKLDDIIVDMVEEPVAMAIVIAGIWYAIHHHLSLPEEWNEWIGHAFQFVIILNVAWLITRLFDALFKQYLVPLAEKSESDLDDQLLPIVRKGTKLVVWIIAIIIALNNAGFDVGAALAGLGIGGLALAMAGKDTVANMFGGLTVFMDQPFKLKDRVKVAGFDGSIEEIGIRSTRLKTLEGRIVTIPNAKFSDSPVENVTLEPGRKVVVNIGLVYDTTADQMESAMEILRGIADGDEGIEEDPLVAFTEFGDSAMNLLFIYWISKEADIMETQTKVNLAILRQFGEAKLDMAFPTRTVINVAA